MCVGAPPAQGPPNPYTGAWPANATSGAGGGGAGLYGAMGLQAAGGLFSAFSQGQGASSSQAYYSYLAATAKTNKALAEAAGKANIEELAYETSDKSRRLNQNIRSTVSAQKAALAARGAGVGSKTGESLLADTLTKGNLDEMALRYNAALKEKSIRTGVSMAKMNYDSEAAGYDIAGSNAKTAGRYSQVSTILGTGASVASTWYRNRGY